MLTRIFFFILMGCASLATINAQEYSVKFQKDGWDNLTEKAASSDKYIMVAAFSEDCDWCDRFETRIFADGKGSSFINERLISKKLDCNNPEDSGLLQEMAISDCPGLLFFDSKGQYVKTLDVEGMDMATFFNEVTQIIGN